MESSSTQLLERLTDSPEAVAANMYGSRLSGSAVSPLGPLNAALGEIFPTRQADTQLQTAKKIMGAEVRDLSDAELGKYITEFQSLIDSWLDEFESGVFDGATLRQLLGGK